VGDCIEFSSREEGVMGVGDSRHGVDLEVLVGADRGDRLDGAPVGERGLSIVEPLVGQVLHVIVVNVRNALGDLGAGNAAVEVKHLGSNLLHHVGGALNGHKLVVEGLAGTNDLNVVDVVTVDGGQADSAVVHLAGEHFVSKEPVSENTAITVRTVEAFSASDIDKFTEKSVHRVILLLDIIEVLGINIDLVVAEHSLQEQETVEVLVFPAGSVVEHTDRRVDHLVVTDHEEARVEDGLLEVQNGAVRSTGHVREVLLCEVNQLLVVNGTGSNDHHVLTKVVSGVEVDDHVPVDGPDVVDVSKNRLSHHVLSVHVVVNIFHESFLGVLVSSFELLPDGVLLHLEVVVVVDTVGQHVAENLSRFGEAVGE